MQLVAAVRRTFYTVFETIAVFFFLVMLSSSIVQVFFRYVLGEPLMWTEELARLMAVGTTYFGSVVVLIAREHIRVDIVETLLGRRSLAVLAIVGDVLIGWFLASVVVGCWLMTQATWTTFTASMDWFRMGYVYAAVGFAVSAMVLILLLDVYTRAMVLAGGDPEADA
ncbi:MAG: TRAP transporter small permease [Hyphomicrobiales bacterium]